MKAGLGFFIYTSVRQGFEGNDKAAICLCGGGAVSDFHLIPVLRRPHHFASAIIPPWYNGFAHHPVLYRSAIYIIAGISPGRAGYFNTVIETVGARKPGNLSIKLRALVFFY